MAVMVHKHKAFGFDGWEGGERCSKIVLFVTISFVDTYFTTQ